ncbi:MAG: hypothetical protein QOK88_09230 [Nitrososphaeraceae archaeon]|nr:hypothetical protein [Nitrososphaeraceae archaeon]
MPLNSSAHATGESIKAFPIQGGVRTLQYRTSEEDGQRTDRSWFAKLCS